MPFEFKLPDLGEGVAEGEIVRWLVSVGEAVRPEQELVEVMTDKVTAALPSPVAGKVLELRGEPGDIVPVGTVLVSIDLNGAVPAAAPSEPAPAAAPQPGAPASAAPAHEGPLPVVPAVRRLARELGVDLAAVQGSGPGGRIVEADVRAAAGEAADEAPAAPPPLRAPAGPPGEVQRIPLRGVRRVIAEHLSNAHRNTAPYTLVEEADFTELVRLRERVQPMAKQQGVRLTYLPFIIAAVGMALKAHPYFNATVDDTTGDLLVHPEQNISLAVHTDDGLMVPVLRNVENRNLLELAREIERLSSAARSGKLTREEMLGGTFSVSSLGAVGGMLGTPMLNTPQVGVLGVHRVKSRPVVRDGHIVAREMGNLSLTLDHRYIDGYTGTEFMETVVQYLEDPALMLFWLAEIRNQG